MPDSETWRIVLQTGFAGFALVLTGLLAWAIHAYISLARQFADVLSKTASVIERHIAATGALEESTRDELRLLRRLHELLISRPCLAAAIRGDVA